MLSRACAGARYAPWVARLAQELALTGSVRNSTDGLLVRIEGPKAALVLLRLRLTQGLPPGAHVESLIVEPAEVLGDATFRIEPSTVEGLLVARVPPDVAVCNQCLTDATSVGNRRNGYALTTCTECGPRYSLIRSMPYDRAASTMAEFVPCARCRQEYSRPTDRRFHSQTNGCPECGPDVWLTAGTKRIVARSDGALQAAVAELRDGRILAVRGVGGYQLAVDATSPNAVRELRRRKGRFGKPLAVMVADLRAAECFATVDHIAREALCSPANPIVVLRTRAPSPLPDEITEGLDTIGLMLPTTPLHQQIVRGCGTPLVLTSGNLEGDPLAFDADVAQRDLSGIADAWLHHNRSIVRPIDDSVIRVIAGRPATIRLARRTGAVAAGSKRPSNGRIGRTSKGGHRAVQRCASSVGPSHRRLGNRGCPRSIPESNRGAVPPVRRSTPTAGL